MPLALISPPLASQPGDATPEEVLRRPPREGLECLLVKMGRTGPLVEPRRGPQAGKSGDPRSQNADTMFSHRDDRGDTVISKTYTMYVYCRCISVKHIVVFRC